VLAVIDLAALAAIFGIVGGLAAAGGFILKWREHQRPTQNQPREALALETAEEMMQLKGLIDTAWAGVLSRGQGWWERPTLADNYDALGRAGREMLARSARIDVAFGLDSEVALKVREAVNAAEAVFNALDRIRLERQDRPMNEDAERQVRKYFEDDREKIQIAREQFAFAQTAFAAAVNER